MIALRVAGTARWIFNVRESVLKFLCCLLAFSNFLELAIVVLNRVDTGRPAGAGINHDYDPARQQNGRQNPDVVTTQDLVLHASMAFYN